MPSSSLGLPGVDLEDDPVGLIDPGLVVADRGRRDQLAVLVIPVTSMRAKSSWPKKPYHTSCATCDRCMSR